jgi:hypothetical protein
VCECSRAVGLCKELLLMGQIAATLQLLLYDAAAAAAAAAAAPHLAQPVP